MTHGLIIRMTKGLMRIKDEVLTKGFFIIKIEPRRDSGMIHGLETSL
jgi:hypothetical protein